jgi:antitoxin component YwqK of YwqJK toxin-antitoxin module
MATPVIAASVQGLYDRTIRRKWLGWLLAAAIAGAGVGWIVLRGRVAPPVASHEPELKLANLERVDGLWRLRAGGTPASGWIVDRHTDGSLKYRSPVRDGMLDGVSEGWHTNGQMQVREVFRSGVAEGTVVRWHPNGRKASEGIARAGKLDGLFSRWHENGVLAERYSLVDGLPHGSARAWFPSGHQKAESIMDHGKVVEQRFWKDSEGPLLQLSAANKEEP